MLVISVDKHGRVLPIAPAQIRAFERAIDTQSDSAPAYDWLMLHSTESEDALRATINDAPNAPPRRIIVLNAFAHKVRASEANIAAGFVILRKLRNIDPARLRTVAFYCSYNDALQTALANPAFTRVCVFCGDGAFTNVLPSNFARAHTTDHYAMYVRAPAF